MSTEKQIAVTETSLKKIFGDFTKTIDTFKKYSDEMVIEGDDTLEVAENNAGQINGFLKSIEDKRKEIKDPYLKAGKAIDAFAKKLAEPLEAIKKKVGDKLANYKTVQEAAARAEKERVEEEAGALAKEKEEELAKITRIESQIIARLFGGYWLNKEGQRKTSAGCQNPTEVDALSEIILKSTPKPDAFKHLQAEYAAMISEVEEKVSKQKARLIEMASSSKTIVDNAKSEMESAKAEAVSDINNKTDEVKNEIIKENRSTVKEAEKEVKEAGKGVRKTIQFEVVDIAAVPKEWIALDDVKVRAWAQENKDLVKKEMKENTGIINGIKFSLKETFVAK